MQLKVSLLTAGGLDSMAFKCPFQPKPFCSSSRFQHFLSSHAGEMNFSLISFFAKKLSHVLIKFLTLTLEITKSPVSAPVISSGKKFV